jgi:hypothetical protein
LVWTLGKFSLGDQDVIFNGPGFFPEHLDRFVDQGNLWVIDERLLFQFFDIVAGMIVEVEGCHEFFVNIFRLTPSLEHVISDVIGGSFGVVGINAETLAGLRVLEHNQP